MECTLSTARNRYAREMIELGLECRGISCRKQVEIARCAMGEMRGHRDTTHEIEIVLQKRAILARACR
jgi:hypothetical protein